MLNRNFVFPIGLLVALSSTLSAYGAEFMFTAVVNNQTLEGRPLDWTDKTMWLLGRDGQLHEFAPNAAKNAKKTSPTFQGYSVTEMRQRLRDEYGSRFEITSTNRYLVAHPRGRGSEWAKRFEDLYRTFVNYFRVRGFKHADPGYPMVAVVFPKSIGIQPIRTKKFLQCPDRRTRTLRAEKQSCLSLRPKLRW